MHSNIVVVANATDERAAKRFYTYDDLLAKSESNGFSFGYLLINSNRLSLSLGVVLARVQYAHTFSIITHRSAGECERARARPSLARTSRLTDRDCVALTRVGPMLHWKIASFNVE